MKRYSVRHISIFIVALLLFASCFSQKESAIWYFGDYAGLDFNSGNPVPLLDSALITKEGCATISDANGNLLFYTDGTTVWDRQHNVMPNGEGLLGHSSSTESAIIVPKPGSTSSYYIFTIDKPSYFLTEDEPIDGINYSEVNMSLNNGFGDIPQETKNRHLITYDTNNTLQSKYKSSEKITAVSHSSGGSVWVITHFVDKFYSFLVDVNGVNSTPIISNTPLSVLPRFNEDGANISAIGYLKVSPNGKKIAIAHSSMSVGSPRSGTKNSGRVLLYDFNNTTGEVRNQIGIINNVYPYGIEFSPNSKLLYVSLSIFDTNDLFVNSLINQYNLESSNIVSSKQIINNSQNVAGAMQLAIDGKIYRAGYETFGVGHNISVIKNPNAIGTACDYSHNSINLDGRAAQLGLPPFVQSIFLASFDYEFTCLNDETHFFITSEDPYDSVLWDFGDGQTSTEIEPFHNYAQSGIYTVSLTFTVNNIQYTPFIKQVSISQPPDVLQNTYELIQCDSYDNNSNDGIATFNLQLANEPLSLFSQEAIQVYYYHTLADANNDIYNSNAITNIYRNQYQGEELVAKVYKANTNCFSIAHVRLLSTQSINLNTFSLEGCDLDEDGVSEFDLDLARNDIIASLNLSTNVNITFHQNINQAAIGTNPLPDIFASQATIIHIRAESNNACYGNGILELNVKPFPNIQNQIVSTCSSDFPVSIETGLSNNEIDLFDYNWDGIGFTNQIQIFEPGVYPVTITDPTTNCDKTITITVYQTEIPQIQELIIDDTNLVVVIDNSTLSDYVYCIDDENGIYQTENTFLNIEPGIHTIYIKDIFDCSKVNKEFFIIGFPKYFTPNGDGKNDHWNIKGLDPARFPNTYIHIFDRYGKFIKQFNPNLSTGWNGKINGDLLTPDDYWYYLKLPSGHVYKGHFSLKI